METRIRKNTNCLVVSSFFFMVPAIYGFINRIWFLSFLLTATSLISANYWRDYTIVLHKKIDVCMARTSFVIFTYHGFIHIQPVWLLRSSIAGMFLALFLYYLSYKEYERWVTYHFLFHIVLTGEQFLILRAIAQA